MYTCVWVCTCIYVPVLLLIVYTCQSVSCCTSVLVSMETRDIRVVRDYSCGSWNTLKSSSPEYWLQMWVCHFLVLGNQNEPRAFSILGKHFTNGAMFPALSTLLTVEEYINYYGKYPYHHLIYLTYPCDNGTFYNSCKTWNLLPWKFVSVLEWSIETDYELLNWNYELLKLLL